MLVLGTRPQIVKSAPLIQALRRSKKNTIVLVHTGQHYDYIMTKQFFEELEMPEPDLNLGVGSGSHGRQTGLIVMRLEKEMVKDPPDLVIVPGDTNSALGGALAASKLGLPIAHLEAGARSFDMMMPEEVNRRLADHCSAILLAPTKNCLRNLKNERVPGKIFLSGDTMLDSLVQHRKKALSDDILDNLGLCEGDYVLLTLHRPANVDDSARLHDIMNSLGNLGQKIVFPVHPRTRVRLRRAGLLRSASVRESVKLAEPVGYHEMIKLTENASIVLTDSGGVQKEAFWLGTPCVVLRENTEWPETLRHGSNYLIGTNGAAMKRAVRTLLSKRREAPLEPARIVPFGEGKASKRIARMLAALSLRPVG